MGEFRMISNDLTPKFAQFIAKEGIFNFRIIIFPKNLKI
jgi:hypothetical protein